MLQRSEAYGRARATTVRKVDQLMCGVAAFIGTATGPLGARELVAGINVLQHHRGPDDQAAVSIDEVTLGYCRLAIIGTGCGGNQPLTSQSGKTTVVFNGEIYNYRELIKRFELSPTSSSDGAVIPELFERYGPDCFALLRGMFAIVALDRETGLVTIARDSFGIKPLHMRRLAGGLAVASEIRALVALADKPTVDTDAVHGFLRFGSVAADRTLFHGIAVLPPNNWQTFNASGAAIAAGRVREFPPPESRAGVAAALIDSVEMHLRSDVPTALLLSAGVDSTAIACAASRLGHKLTCLTLQVAGVGDEAPVAGETAARYGHEHRVVSSEISSTDVEQFFRAAQSPSIDGLNTWLVSRAVAESGHRVALSGLGADELLGGYSHFKALRGLRYLALLDRSGLTRSLLPRLLSGKRRELLSRGGPRTAWALSALHRSVWDGEAATSAVRAAERPVASADRRGRSVADMVLAETELYLQPTLLRDADAHSMAHSIELRVPFVDLDVFASSLAYVSGGRPGKQELIRQMADRRLSEIAARKKTGFSLPMKEWMISGPLRPFVDAALEQEAPVWQHLNEGTRSAIAGASRPPERWSLVWAVVALDQHLRTFA